MVPDCKKKKNSTLNILKTSLRELYYNLKSMFKAQKHVQ